MINIEILKMQLEAIAETIESYTSEANVKGMSNNSLMSIKKGDLDLFIYCCTGIKEWYDKNINNIYSNEYVFNKEGHDKSKKNIEDIVKDLHESKDEYIKLFSLNKTIKKYELPKGEFNKVFIVHGKDKEVKFEVARYLERLGLEAIILHEQVNKGETIIEKIEKYTDVGYAIILYTPCDIGKLKDEDGEGKFRARQNVVFEHGYLLGKIGRERISALVKGYIELPNDLSGVVYTDMDVAGAWKINIAKEMKAVGYSVDMNKLF